MRVLRHLSPAFLLPVTLAVTSGAAVVHHGQPSNDPVAPVASCVKAPVPAATSTRFGTSVSVTSTSFRDSLAAQDRRFGRMDAVRVFRNSAPPSYTWERNADVLANRTVMSSFRVPPAKVLAGAYDSAFLHYFRGTPSNVQLYWTYYHEPESEIRDGAFSASSYRAAFRHLVDLGQRACRPNVYPTLVLTGWTAESASKRNWRDYYPGSDYISALGWDPYNGASYKPTSYRTPSSMLDPAVRISNEAGKPFGIAETGSIRVGGDSTGEQRARWLDALGAYLVNRRARFVTYFDTVGGPLNQDFRLRDTPSINAWRRWVGR